MSSPRTDLAQTLRRLDGSSYGAYKQLKGSWRLGDAELIVDRVQSDPYAPPSLARIRVSLSDTGIPPELIATMVDLGSRAHRHQRDHDLAVMAAELLAVVHARRHGEQ